MACSLHYIGHIPLLNGPQWEELMKKKNLLHIFVLMISLSLVGCGSDENATGSDSSNNSTLIGQDIPDAPLEDESGTGPSSSFNDFKAKVANGEFASAQGFYGEHVFESNGQVKDGYKVHFRYSRMKKGSFLGMDTWSSSGTPGERILRNGSEISRESYSMDSVFGNNLSALKSNLAQKVQNAESYSQCGTNCYWVKITNRWYAISLNHPMIANPLVIQTDDTRYEYSQAIFYYD